MKNILLTSLIALSTFLSATAQKFEGEITYKISYSDLPAEMEMYKAMLPAKSVILMKNEKSVTEQNTMGIMKMKIISNSKTMKTSILMDMMGKKIVMESDSDSEETKSDLEVTKTSETKTIAGYKCKKAIVKDKDGNEMVYWYTKDLPGYKGKNIPNLDLDGFPMEFEAKQETMSMTMSVTS
ncbi:MAG: DUF4412 domain-containing protein, partial [Flavobacteriales bacterium]